MRRFVDLHTHSTASDGSLPPRKLIRAADRANLAAVALTDHDTLDGLAEAAEEARHFPRLHFIPGIELSANYSGGSFHILGLNIDPQSDLLKGTLLRLQNSRNERNPKILHRLGELGVELSMEDVQAVMAELGEGHVGPIMGRMHIAEALRRKGYVKSNADAFAQYIGNNGPAYVNKERLSAGEAIRLIRQAGGLAVLAHPSQLNLDNRAQLERILRELIAAGLQGIEVYHSTHSPEQTRQYLTEAQKFNLLITGGSDFHGSPKPDVVLGRPRISITMLGKHPEAARLIPPY